MVPVLLLAGNKEFGISSTFRHLCAVVSSKPAYLRYDWKKQGGWQLALALGVVAGGWLAASFFAGGRMPGLTAEARQLFQSWGVALDASGYQPDFLARWSEAWSGRGLVSLVGGGFLVGFGTRWANGCTSGHAIIRKSATSPAGSSSDWAGP